MMLDLVGEKPSKASRDLRGKARVNFFSLRFPVMGKRIPIQ